MTINTYLSNDKTSFKHLHDVVVEKENISAYLHKKSLFIKNLMN